MLDLSPGAIPGQPASSRPNPHNWTSAERELIRQWYGKVSTEKLAERIGVSPKAVSLVASHLRVSAQPYSERHVWTEEEDEILRREYELTHASRDRLAAKLGVTKHQVGNRLSVLGLRKRTQRRPWSPSETTQLEKLLDGGRTQQAIARSMGRSTNSIKIRANRFLRHRFRDRSGWYTKMEACGILGVDHKWIQTRIDSGVLKARPHFEGDTPQKSGQHPWHIEERDLAEFIRTYPHELNGRNVDLVAIVSLLSSLKASPFENLSDVSIAHYRGQGWTHRRIAEFFGVPRSTIASRLARAISK